MLSKAKKNYKLMQNDKIGDIINFYETKIL